MPVHNVNTAQETIHKSQILRRSERLKAQIKKATKSFRKTLKGHNDTTRDPTTLLQGYLYCCIVCCIPWYWTELQ